MSAMENLEHQTKSRGFHKEAETTFRALDEVSGAASPCNAIVVVCGCVLCWWCQVASQSGFWVAED